MIKKAFIILLLMSAKFLAISQQDYSKSYKPIVCKGDIPNDFKVSYIDKYEEDIKNIPLNKSRKEIADLREFYLKSGYSIKSIFASGGVLFGDELTNYVNKVARVIMEKNDITEDIRFYVIKSSQVNAFCTSEGVIFVTVGLLSQIENESQLAFTLSHEIIHFTEKHSIESFGYTKQEEKYYKRGRSSYEGVIKNLSDFSQENELESDRKGFLLMEKAGYDVNEAKKMISVLEYSHLPFDEIVFDTNYFNDDFYKIPTNKFKSLTDVVEDEEDETEIKTHPEYEERKTKIDELIEDENTLLTGKKYFFKESTFQNVRTRARFENLKLNLLNQSYIRVMYEGYILEKQYPNNTFVKENIAKALYGIAKRKTANKEADYDKTIEGEYNVVVNFFINNIDGLEASILAIKYIEKFHLTELKQYQSDLASDIYHEYNFNYLKFKKEKQKNDSVNQVVKKKDTIAYEDMSKIEKLEYKKKKKKKTINKGESHDYYEYAFVNELKNKEFVAVFNEAKNKEKQKTEKEETEGMGYKERRMYIKNEEKNKKQLKDIKVDKLLAIDPIYKYSHKKIEKKLIRSEKKEIKYIEILEKSSNTHDIELTVLSEHNLKDITIEEYNKRAQLKECISELLDADELSMIPTSSELLDSLMIDYNTNHLLFSGVFSFKPNISPLLSYNLLIIIPTVLMIPTILPIYLTLSLRKKRSNIYYNAIYNTKNRKFEVIDTKTTNGKDNFYNSVSILNDLMKQIKTSK